MLFNHMKITLRSLGRHKSMTLINVISLSLGLTASIVAMVFVMDESAYDSYHQEGDRISRVTTHSVLMATGEELTTADSPFLWGPALKREYPEVEEYVRFYKATDETNPWEFRQGDAVFRESAILYADASVFGVFSWPLVHGNPRTALTAPNTVVLSERMAGKFFGNENPVGKTLPVYVAQWNQDGQFTRIARQLTVTGVMQNIPRQSHFTAEMFVSFVSLNEVFGADLTNGVDLNPGFWRWRFVQTYLLLKEGADRVFLTTKLDDFLERHVHESSKARGFYFKSFLQPLSEIYLAGNVGGQLAPVGDRTDLYLFSLIAFFILLVGCMNYVNLTTARSMQRMKEVAVRKIMGGRPDQLFGQFMTESGLLTLVSLLLAVGLSEWMLPMFYEYAGKVYVPGAADRSMLIAGLVTIGVLVCALSGSYPAIVLSRFKPAFALKPDTRGAARGAILRKSLVVFQFALSVFFVIAAIVVGGQIGFMKAHDLGFGSRQVLVLPPSVVRPLMGSYDSFKSELLRQKDVITVTGSSTLPGFETGGDLYGIQGAPGADAIPMAEYSADPELPVLLGLTVIAGRRLSADVPADAGVLTPEGRLGELSVLINEEALRKFGWTAEAAIGRKIVRDPKAVDYTGTIVGVVRDFHFQSLREPIAPLVINLLRPYRFIAVKVHTANIEETISSIKHVVQRFLPDAPFEASFLDKDFERQYGSEQRTARVFEIVSLLAIVVACLGLFGVTAFTIERRTKEIGLRKVLGAEVAGIVGLLSKDFLKLVVVANILAWPTAWFIMNQWLEDFSYRITIDWWVFAAAGCASCTIALATVSIQAIRSARANPVEALRYE
jgi:putative ABC transport system permease protein